MWIFKDIELVHNTLNLINEEQAKFDLCKFKAPAF